MPVAQQEITISLRERAASSLRTDHIGGERRYLSYLMLATLVACAGATRPDGDGLHQQTSDVSHADASPPEQDAGVNDGPLDCTFNLAYGLNVMFEKPAVACGELSVVATDGGYTDTLHCDDFDGAHCNCYGAEERPGTYQITVSLGNPPIELARSEPVTATSTPCHVVGQSVVLQLLPLPTDAGVATPSDAGGAPGADAAPQ